MEIKIQLIINEYKEELEEKVKTLEERLAKIESLLNK